MPEAAPVAAAVTPTPSNGADGPVKPVAPVKPSVKPGPKVEVKPTGRHKDGTYLPKPSEEPAPEEAEAKPDAPPEEEAEELFEVKVNGQTRQVTRNQLLVMAQKAEASDKKFQEAAALTKKAEEMIAAFEKDPEAALAKAGKDPAKVLEELLARKAREASLTPEQRELEQLKRERDEFKAKTEAHEKAQKDAEQEQQDAKTAAAIEKTLLSSAEKYGLDRNPETLELLCDVALELVGYGIQPTPEQICEEVVARQRQTLTDRDRKVLARLVNDPDKLAEYLGPQAVEALSRRTLKEIPAPGAAKPKAKAAPAMKVPDKGYLSESEFNKKYGL